MFFALVSAVVLVPSGSEFTCTPIRVWDGDGPIWCAEGVHVRVAGIAAREIDGSCRSNQPCPATDPIKSRNALVNLIGRPISVAREGHVIVRGPTMACVSVGEAGGTRTAAWCVSPIGGDLSCAMVGGGWALQWPQYWRHHLCDTSKQIENPRRR